MLKIICPDVIGHVETDPARKAWAKAVCGPDISREFAGDTAADDAMAWLREIMETPP